MSKLLNKPFRVFTVYAFIVLAGSIPVYYRIVDYIWRHELDENNEIYIGKVKRNLGRLGDDDSVIQSAIATWNKLLPETSIEPADALRPDSVYNLYRNNIYLPGDPVDRFQGRVSYFRLHDRIYRVAVETNVEESAETIWAMTAVAAGFFLILLAGFLILNKRISGRLWRPFYNTLSAMSAYELGEQQSLSLGKTDIVEFRQLNESVEKMEARSRATYREQREFTENASHELQTPLAILQAKLDLLQQQPGLSERQSRLIDEANNAVSRVARINKNLVLLARIENDQYAGLEPVDFGATVEEVWSSLRDYASTKNLDTQASIHPGVVRPVNRSLLEILVGNLLVNAIRHTPQGGIIAIFLGPQQLLIRNSGDQELATDKLFRRFSRAGTGSAGSGLGLAIVKSIADRYGWSVGYRYSAGYHEFECRFGGVVEP